MLKRKNKRKRIGIDIWFGAFVVPVDEVMSQSWEEPVSSEPSGGIIIIIMIIIIIIIVYPLLRKSS